MIRKGTKIYPNTAKWKFEEEAKATEPKDEPKAKPIVKGRRK